MRYPRTVVPSLVDIRDGTAWITLRRPEAKNAIDVDTMNALRQAIIQLEADASVHRVVLTGHGDVFSAGGDIKDMVARRGQSLATLERHINGYADIVERILNSAKVYVARVGGDAIGAGLGLVLACDLAIASSNARFVAAFARLGLVADTGVGTLLARTVGRRRAREMLLTARPVEASQALEWGLVNQVVEPKALDEAVAATIDALASLPAQTLARIKSQLERNAATSVSDGLRYEAILQGVAFATPEHAERADAFVNRKKEDKRGH
jgi:enoyl-CoA hydratase/carnithine racemase